MDREIVRADIAETIRHALEEDYRIKKIVVNEAAVGPLGGHQAKVYGYVDWVNNDLTSEVITFAVNVYSDDKTDKSIDEEFEAEILAQAEKNAEQARRQAIIQNDLYPYS